MMFSDADRPSDDAKSAAAKILNAARDGANVPEDAITWALTISGDLIAKNNWIESCKPVRIEAQQEQYMTAERYSREDDDLIRKYYPTEGADVVHRLNSERTRNAVKTRAAVLRVFQDLKGGERRFSWTSEDEGVLITRYHLIGPVGCFHALEGRFSIISIKGKAKRFNLKAPKPERNYLAEKEPIGECEDEYPIVQRWVQQWERPQVERPASIFRMAA